MAAFPRFAADVFHGFRAVEGTEEIRRATTNFPENPALAGGTLALAAVAGIDWPSAAGPSAV